MSWETVSLASICSIEKQKASGSGIYVGLEHVEAHTGRWAEIPVEKEVKSSTFAFEPGHILYGRLRPYLNKVIIPEFSGHCSTEIFPIRPSKTVDSRYLFYWLSAPSTVEKIDETCTGTRMPRANINEVMEFDFPLPPLEEQRRIVALLDKVFTALDTAIANTEKNLANARQLFESHLAETFGTEEVIAKDALGEPEVAKNADPKAPSYTGQSRTGGRKASTRAIQGRRGLGVGKQLGHGKKGWQWSALTSLASLESGHTPSRRKPEYWGGTVPWVGIRDAKAHNGNEIAKTRENTNELGLANSSARLLPKGTVCLSRTASVGYVVVMGAEMATSQDFVNWVCGKMLEPDFLKYLFMAQGKDIFRFSSGSVHQTIYYPEVKAFQIHHPAIDEQRRVVALSDEVRDFSRKLQHRANTKLLELQTLKQSILQRAFSGELTAPPQHEIAEAIG